MLNKNKITKIVLEDMSKIFPIIRNIKRIKVMVLFPPKMYSIFGGLRQ